MMEARVCAARSLVPAIISGGHMQLSDPREQLKHLFLCGCGKPRAVFRLCQAGLSHCHAANWGFPGIWHRGSSQLV